MPPLQPPAASAPEGASGTADATTTTPPDAPAAADAPSTSAASGTARDFSGRAILERPAPDQGYYFIAGLHGALVHVVDDGRAISSLPGYSLTFRIGQSITSYFDLGFRLDVATIAASDRDGFMTDFGLDATLRPSGRWLFRLGGGMGGGKLSAAPDSDDKASNFGAVLAFEAGYQLFPFYSRGESGGVGFTPLLRMTSVQPGTDDAHYWLMLGIDVTWWTGLPKNQLDLTLEEAFPEAR